MARIRLGETFNSFETDFLPELEKYEKTNFVNLVIKKSKLDVNNLGLKYEFVSFLCKFHGNHQKIGNTRQTKSYQIGCKSGLSLQC